MDKNLESLKAVIRKGFEKADSRNEYTKRYMRQYRRWLYGYLLQRHKGVYGKGAD